MDGQFQLKQTDLSLILQSRIIIILLHQVKIRQKIMEGRDQDKQEFKSVVIIDEIYKIEVFNNALNYRYHLFHLQTMNLRIREKVRFVAKKQFIWLIGDLEVDRLCILIIRWNL
ncbi:unnamed protein product [Paramecium pentaurelia]|uniref:Uncharacterized protein n=1 Tax=Paramecium pentaurelia TaxID=43138 RepID=A0A8S1X222_9CILI|nr:unnamed protein product [Paramecium pentaurelia]